MPGFLQEASEYRANSALRYRRKRKNGSGREAHGCRRDRLGGGGGDLWGRILRKSIEDDRQNFTRFFLLRAPEYARLHPWPASEHAIWKTSLVFSTRNVPGSLFRALSAFALRDLNLAKIESRPLRGKPWEYLFYLDFWGKVDAPNAQNALHHVGEVADFMRVLGCYPKGA